MLMNNKLLPMNHMHNLLDEIVPEMRWDGNTNFEKWLNESRNKLYELLGIPEIEKHRTDFDLNIEYDRIDKEKEFREIRFTFCSEENVIVPCHLVFPIVYNKPLPTAICLQGHGTGMHISLGRTKYPGDENDFRGDRDFAVKAVKEGICAVALEQRCFGECGGTEKGPDCQQASLRALLLGRTIIGERVWDIMRLIDVLKENFGSIADTERIMCMGNSGGGTATIYASALDERIKISVPSCAIARYADSIGAMRHCECNYVPKIAQYYDMGDLCAMVAPRKLLIVTGETDPIFPVESAKQCAEVAKRIYEKLGVPQFCNHVIGDGGHRFYADASWGYIREYLENI